MGGRKGKTILYLMSDDTDEETMRCECQFSVFLSRAVYTRRPNRTNGHLYPAQSPGLSGGVSGYPFGSQAHVGLAVAMETRGGFMFRDQIGEAFFGSF